MAARSKDVKPGAVPGKEKEIKGQYAVSRIFPNGALAEMLYIKGQGKSGFAVSGKDGVQVYDQLLVGEDGNITHDEKSALRALIPTRMVGDLVEKNFIYIASKPEEYGTTLDLYQQIRSLIKTYVILEDERFYDVATGYVLMTWVFDRFTTIPYLRVVGEFGTGKSRFLKVVGKLCYRSMIASGSISTAAVYRTLDLVAGTLVFDEADFKSSDMSDEIVKLLNGGYEKDTPTVRMEVTQNSMKTVTFRVFGPKILGSRRNFEDTALESRCLTQRLFPMENVNVPVHLPPEFDAETQALRNKLLMFRFKNFYQICDDESSLGGIGFSRLKQASLALTSVVKTVGEEQLKSVHGFLLDYEKAILNRVSTDPLADVLLCIARLVEFDEQVQKSGQLTMNALAQAFNDRYYDDYAQRETREVDTRNGPLTIPGQCVSPRKIGVYVDKLGLAKARSSQGVYIPLSQEAQRINALIERYRLTDVLVQEREEAAELKRNPVKAPRIEFVPDEDAPF